MKVPPRFTLVAALAAAVACDYPTGSGQGQGERGGLPVLQLAAIAPIPGNVLGAVAVLRARRGDSAAVLVALAGESTSNPSATPFVPLIGDSATIPVLGLLPGRHYVARIAVRGPGGETLSDSLDLTAGELPADLPRYEAGGPDASPGFVVFAAGRYGIVIDNTGRVVWYRQFPSIIGLSFMAQPNGRFTLRPQTPDPADLEPWLEVDRTGSITRTLGCAGGLQPRPHDLIAQPDNSYWIMCDETRRMDLRGIGGLADAAVTGTVVQHVGADGRLHFQWSPFDHFSLTDLELAQRSGPSVNWTHGNAIDLDPRGHLLVSFRNLSEIASIDTSTGAVRWRLGGIANQFRFVDVSTPAFSGQHSARAVADGSLLVFDNVGAPSESRAERYVVDEEQRTLRVAHSYGSPLRAQTITGGSTQSLPDGRTLVSFGTAGRVEEYDVAGRVTWQVFGNPGYVFRAQRITSLYFPGVGTAR